MASVKDEVRALLDSLPDDVTLEDVQYQLYVRQRIARGLRDLDEGRIVSHEDVVREMSQWLEG